MGDTAPRVSLKRTSTDVADDDSNQASSSKAPRMAAASSSATMTPTMSPGLCDYCSRDRFVAGEYCCVSCNMARICEACCVQHKKNGDTVVDGENKYPRFCEKHVQITNFFCTDCSNAVCIQCMMGDHSEHSFVRTTKLARQHKDAVMQFCDQAEDLSKKVNELLDGANVNAATDNSLTESYLKQLEQFRGECIARLDEVISEARVSANRQHAASAHLEACDRYTAELQAHMKSLQGFLVMPQADLTEGFAVIKDTHDKLIRTIGNSRSPKSIKI
jgi:hypothetical protein